MDPVGRFFAGWVAGDDGAADEELFEDLVEVAVVEAEEGDPAVYFVFGVVGEVGFLLVRGEGEFRFLNEKKSFLLF